MDTQPQPAPALEDKVAEAARLQELETQIVQAIRTCYDPEIPVNIVDLGLIYSMVISPLSEGDNRVDVKMTLTAQGCGMGVSIAADAQGSIDIRVRTMADAAAIETELRNLQPRIPGTRLEVHGGFTRPPLERSSHVVRLLEIAREVADQLSIAIQFVGHQDQDGNSHRDRADQCDR